MLNLSDLYFGPLPVRLAGAADLYARFGSRLHADPRAASLLGRIDSLSLSLREQMTAMGIPALCAECGSRPSGGCCSAEMANEMDGVLLLANLLLGVEVAARRGNDLECCFLGAQGCTFLLKPIFCLNYNCRRILAGTTRDLLNLERATGRLLTAQTELEESIVAFLRPFI